MSLPLFPSFDYDADKSNAGPRWEKWVGRLENLLVGMAITNDGRKRALLLHYAGERVYDIYDAEKGTSEETFEATKTVLTNYFAPKKNVQMEIYEFRSYEQTNSQTLDEYVTELRTLAKNFEFIDCDAEILQQLIQHCKSNRLRRALREPDKTLAEILALGRSLELSEEQAQVMEKERESVNAINRGRSKPSRGKGKQRPQKSFSESNHSWHTNRSSQKCRNCGGEYPHRNSCPAKGKLCNYCKKPNHFMKVCMKKRRNQNVNEIHEGAVGGQSDSDEEEYCYG
ncbi:uncharacterized protein LOC123526819 [Mercenaria mercenaria]|uniref:uncharacterized protein LOC123526819 n=1 Tax=Mercenaria mercenaria TaxID=6596 RepID=UPI00234EC625|nr:uncharacterized protein LOC123526819 [Mercenaria mercenaria]